MPGDLEARIGMINVMPNGNTAERHGRTSVDQIPLGRNLPGSPVMIPADQHHGDTRVARAPRGNAINHRPREPMPGMNKIARNVQHRRVVPDDEFIQARKVVIKRPTGNGNPTRMKSLGLAEVEIGDNERAQAGPPYGSLRKKVQLLPRRLNDDHAAHEPVFARRRGFTDSAGSSAARSSSSDMRRTRSSQDSLLT